MITFDLMNTFTWLSQSLKINMCSDYKNRRKIVPKQDLKQCEWSDVKGKRYEVGNEIRRNLKCLKYGNVDMIMTPRSERNLKYKRKYCT